MAHWETTETRTGESHKRRRCFSNQTSGTVTLYMCQRFLFMMMLSDPCNNNVLGLVKLHDSHYQDRKRINKLSKLNTSPCPQARQAT